MKLADVKEGNLLSIKTNDSLFKGMIAATFLDSKYPYIELISVEGADRIINIYSKDILELSKTRFDKSVSDYLRKMLKEMKQREKLKNEIRTLEKQLHESHQTIEQLYTNAKKTFVETSSTVSEETILKDVLRSLRENIKTLLMNRVEGVYVGLEREKTLSVTFYTYKSRYFSKENSYAQREFENADIDTLTKRFAPHINLSYFKEQLKEHNVPFKELESKSSCDLGDKGTLELETVVIIPLKGKLSKEKAKALETSLLKAIKKII